MRLGTLWNECILYYRNGRKGGIPTTLWHEIQDLHREHLLIYPQAEKGNCWYDLRHQVVFSGAQYRGGPGRKDHHFKASADEFVAGRWGMPFVEETMGTITSFDELPVRTNSECIYSHHPRFDDYQDKSLLIVLGGPSAREVPWERLETDFVWSCNKFYQAPRFAAGHYDLVALAPNVDLSDEQLHRYLDRHDTLIAFEAERGSVWNYWDDTYPFLEKYAYRCVFFHPRYDSAIGIGPRLICFAAFLGFSEIYFAGLDGVTSEGPRHAFEAGKENPGWFKQYGPGLQNRHFVILWDYLLGLRSEYRVRYYNLGEGVAHNVTSGISRQVFPLPRRVRNRLDIHLRGLPRRLDAFLHRVALYAEGPTVAVKQRATSPAIVLGVAVIALTALIVQLTASTSADEHAQTTVSTERVTLTVEMVEEILSVAMRNTSRDTLRMISLEVISIAGADSVRERWTIPQEKLMPDTSFTRQMHTSEFAKEGVVVVLEFATSDAVRSHLSLSLKQ